MILVPMARKAMITVAWGNFLTLVPPGLLVLIALEGRYPQLARLLADPNQLELTGAAYLLILATLAGGVLEAVRCVTLDRYLPLLRRFLQTDPVAIWKLPQKILLRAAGCQRTVTSAGAPSNLYEFITSENLDLFQAAVDNSWKYYTFYGNLTLSLILFSALAIWDSGWGIEQLVYSAMVLISGYASYMQHASFAGRIRGLVEVEKRTRGGK